jgi:aminoglycoside phosphotransferase family enzyme
MKEKEEREGMDEAGITATTNAVRSRTYRLLNSRRNEGKLVQCLSHVRVSNLVMLAKYL